MNKDKIIRLRLSQNERECIHQKVKQLGYSSMSSFVLSRCLDIPVKNYAIEKALWHSIVALTKEFNAIGKNINQVVKDLHFIRQNIIVHTCQGDQLIKLLDDYNVKRHELSLLLENSIKGIGNGI